MSQQILMALAGVVGLGVACQWVAWRLRIPAILLLLLAGLMAGGGSAYLSQAGWLPGRLLNPDELFKDLLLPLVSLSVALILFEGGLTLNLAHLREGTSIIWKLVMIGATVSGALSAVTAHYMLELQWGLSILLGSILVVTGPTVIGPLLRDVRPTGQVGPVLRWEGIVIDPVGALLAVVVFEVVAFGQTHPVHIAWSILKTLLVGGAIGGLSAWLLAMVIRRHWAPDYLHIPVTVMLVLLAFAASNGVQHESGLAAVTVMGIVLANQKRAQIQHILEFKESLSLLLISSLFILLSARLSPVQLKTLDWRVVAFIAVLIVFVRPASVFLSTVGSKLAWRDRLFIAGLAPRGIVAAAVASVFALRLLATGMQGADRLVPLTFAVVAGTVMVYGLGAPFLAQWLGLSRPGATGFLIVGADALARSLATALQKESYEVLLVDTNPQNVRDTRLAGLPVVLGNALSGAVEEAIALSSIGRVMALTPNHEVNSLVAMQFARHFGRQNVFQLSPRPARKDREKINAALTGQWLFADGVTYENLQDRLGGGGTIKSTKLTKDFDYAAFRALHHDEALPMFVINDRRELSVVTPALKASPKAGSTLMSLVPDRQIAVPLPAPPAASEDAA